VTGALFSAYEGIEALTARASEPVSPIVSYVVLGIFFLLEATSLVRRLQQTRTRVGTSRASGSSSTPATAPPPRRSS